MNSETETPLQRHLTLPNPDTKRMRSMTESTDVLQYWIDQLSALSPIIKAQLPQRVMDGKTCMPRSMITYGGLNGVGGVKVGGVDVSLTDEPLFDFRLFNDKDEDEEVRTKEEVEAAEAEYNKARDGYVQDVLIKQVYPVVYGACRYLAGTYLEDVDKKKYASCLRCICDCVGMGTEGFGTDAIEELVFKDRGVAPGLFFHAGEAEGQNTLFYHFIHAVKQVVDDDDVRTNDKTTLPLYMKLVIQTLSYPARFPGFETEFGAGLHQDYTPESIHVDFAEVKEKMFNDFLFVMNRFHNPVLFEETQNRQIGQIVEWFCGAGGLSKVDDDDDDDDVNRNRMRKLLRSRHNAYVSTKTESKKEEE